MSEPSAARPVTRTDEPEKRVSWAELFFDLVFVFAVTDVSALLRADESWAGLGRSLIVFVPIYWCWVGISVHANTHDIENPLDRIGIFTLGLCAMFMALAVPGAYTQRGVLFGASYLAARIILAALIFRVRPITLNAYLVGLVFTGPLLLAGGLLPYPARVTLWALAAVVDLATPAVIRRRLVSIRFHPNHLPERFGLFLIIALGESVVSIGTPAAAAPQLHVGGVAAVAVAFALACGLWWVYFHFAADAMRHAIATTSAQSDIVREVLSYGHLAFISAIIAVADGSAGVVAHPDQPLDTAAASLLFGGCALYLATFGYTRWRMFRSWATTRLGASVVVIALLPAAIRMPALGALGLLLAVVLSLNVVEFQRVKHRSAE